MRKIENYIPPSIDDLKRLKEELSFTGNEIAAFCGLSNGNQWRKYTGGEHPRSMNQHILFFIAAQLALDNNEIKKVFSKMSELGAEFNMNDELKKFDVVEFLDGEEDIHEYLNAAIDENDENDEKYFFKTLNNIASPIPTRNATKR